MTVDSSEREQQLFDKFADSAIRRGDELYFDRTLAMQFLDLCDSEDFAVIGIEGFRLTNSSTEPDMALIADYSGRVTTARWPEVRQTNNDDARQFLRAAGDGLFFNFVVSSPEDPVVGD